MPQRVAIESQRRSMRSMQVSNARGATTTKYILLRSREGQVLRSSITPECSGALSTFCVAVLHFTSCERRERAVLSWWSSTGGNATCARCKTKLETEAVSRLRET